MGRCVLCKLGKCEFIDWFYSGQIFESCDGRFEKDCPIHNILGRLEDLEKRLEK